MEINKEFLQAVIHKLANQKQIFSNESQFQFNLAVLLEKELRNAFEQEQSSVDWEILLEEQIIEREYTDIVIRLGNLYYPRKIDKVLWTIRF